MITEIKILEQGQKFRLIQRLFLNNESWFHKNKQV